MTAEEYISRIPMWTRKKNSLEQVRAFLTLLGNPDRKLSIIHVAGSNGKGSVCAYLTSALRNASYHTGTFISPHLVNVRERFLLDQIPVSQRLFEECFVRVKETADQWVNQGFAHPTFFEFLFYLAMLLFERQKVDFAILETGLGGRLDTTNVTEHPLLSVITSISLEHTRYLGDTIEAIAGEKAGIIKENVPVVFDANSAAAAKVLRGRAEMVHAPVYPVQRSDFIVSRTKGKRGLVFSWQEEETAFVLPFPAPYQADNGALAWKALRVLMDAGIIGKEKKELLRQGMEKTVWPGRMEEVRPGVYFDGAHNPDGIRAFAEAAKEVLRQRENPRISRKVLLLSAVSADKDYREMVLLLCRELAPDLAVLTRISDERGLDEKELAGCWKEEGSCPVHCFDQAKEAFRFLLDQKGEHDIAFCLGSLYLIGELKAETGGKNID